MAGEGGITVTITGLPELLGRIRNLQVRKPLEVAEAIRASAQDAMDFANPLCRVDTGFMVSRNQIRIVNQFSAEFFNDCEYAIYNELGTSRMSAQPWIVPGYTYGKSRLLERLGIIAGTP